MQYYQYDKYPIEFVLSENIDKHFEYHNHASHYVISVVLQGTAVLCLDDREAVCRKGDVFIIPPYAIHSVRQGKYARLLSMCIGTAFIKETNIETAEEFFRKLSGEAVSQGIFGKEQGNTLLVSVREVYCHWDNGWKEMDSDIKILTDKIVSCPEQERSAESLAADIFVSKYYLIRKFRNSVGMTPHQFCIQNRIRKSQSLLDGEKTISRIAAEMGFYDQSHFDKAFHRIVGISPSEYIRSKKRIGQSI